MSPAQAIENKKYFLLNQSEHLDVVLHGTAKEFERALHGAVNIRNIERAINNEQVFKYGTARNCIIVEDFDYNESLKKPQRNRAVKESQKKPEEKWMSFKNDNKAMWYVSNLGRVKKKVTETGEELWVVTRLNRRGIQIAVVGRQRVPVKDLVASTFMQEEYKKYANPVVKVIDDNQCNCAVSNLKITEGQASPDL